MSASTDSDLDELLARLAEGDRSVFSRVFSQLWPPALRLCRSLLGNEADASDAAQEALEKVFSRASDYERGRPALPWALAIAAWECRTILRRRSRRREVWDEDRPESVAEGATEEELAQRELVRFATEAMGELSGMDREVLVSTFWDEASSIQGATLRKRRQRAIDRLRRSMKRLYGL